MTHRDVPGLTIRDATAADAEVINAMIWELAQFEQLQDQCHSTVEQVATELGRTNPTLFAVIAELAGEKDPIGMATWFETYSTFAAHRGMYLEDLYVRQAFRHQGIGSQLLRHLAKIARAKDYRRLEWLSLVWNTDALEFYESLGSRPSDVWTNFRLAGEWLDRLADS
jgi:GNAT superfamily N-acetyltransferase